MLQSIHDNAKGWVAYIIVFLISIPFALWGIHSYTGGGDDKAAASVNGEEIPVSVVRNELQELKQQFAQFSGFNDDSLKQLALDRVVGRTLLEQEIKEHGFIGSNDEVVNTIVNIPAFQKDGKFDQETYEQVLKANRRNESVFESQIRSEIAAEQLQGLVAAASFVPMTEAEQYQALQEQKRDLDSFTLKAADYKDQIEVSEQEVADYYEQNKLAYMTEERVKVDYVEINRDELSKSLNITAEEVQSYYDQNKDRYIVPEKRHISHILIPIEGMIDPANVDPAKDKAASDKAEALYVEIAAGTRTFEDVAKTDSADTLSADKGGDLGVYVAGDREKAFENIVFSTSEGTVAEPIKTSAGYEILKVTKIEPVIQKSFDEAKTDVEKDYREEQAADLYHSKDDELPTLAYENEADLTPVAAALDIEKKTSGWITRNVGEGIGKYPQVREIIFTEDMKVSGKNSERIDLAEGHVAVVRVIELESPTQKPLADVSAQIVQTLEADKLRKLLQEKGDALVAALEESQSWTALAAQGVGAEEQVTKHGFISRKDKSLAFDMLSQAFSMPKPAEGKQTYIGSMAQGGDYQVIALKGVQDGDKKLDDTLQKGFNLYLSNRQTSMLLQALREEADVELYPENI